MEEPLPQDVLHRAGCRPGPGQLSSGRGRPGKLKIFLKHPLDWEKTLFYFLLFSYPPFFYSLLPRKLFPYKQLVAWSYSTAPNRETPYSNTANFLGLFAPSHNAYTTARGGGYTSNFGGTSAACPYAAGAAAVLQSAAKTLNGGFLAPGSVRSILAGIGDLITDVKISHQKRRINLGNAVAAFTSSVPAAGPSILIMGLPILAGILILRRKSR
jgi:hypothetical protein